MNRNLLVGVVVVVAVACSGVGSTDGQSDTTAGSTSQTTANAPAATNPPATSGSGEPKTIELDVANPPTYDSGSGIQLTIDDARVGDLTSLSASEKEDLAIALDDPNSASLLILTITVTNGSAMPIAFFPDQGTALIGQNQVDANFFLSESFTGSGGTILDGATVTQDIYFELSQSAADVAALGQARYTVSAPFDDDTFEPLGEDVDITVNWSS